MTNASALSEKKPPLVLMTLHYIIFVIFVFEEFVQNSLGFDMGMNIFDLRRYGKHEGVDLKFL